MKVPRTIETHEADLSIEELETLAEEIRMIVTKGIGVALSEYLEKANVTSRYELGYRKTRALQFEQKLEAYFPDEVFAILRRKGATVHIQRFNDSDDAFIRANIGRGASWMADRFYTNSKSIHKRVRRLGLSCSPDGHKWTREDDTIIRQNVDKGYKWLSEKLSVSMDCVRGRARRLKINVFVNDKHKYSKEEDAFIRKHASEGSVWLSEKMGHSSASIRERSGRIKVKLTCINNGVVLHKFTKKDDNFIRKNSEKGSDWIGLCLGIARKSIQYRARKIKVKLISRQQLAKLTTDLEKDIECEKEKSNRVNGRVVQSSYLGTS